MFPEVIQQAAENHSPALVANYTYDLVKEFNSFYQNVSILGEDELAKNIPCTIVLFGLGIPLKMHLAY